MSETMPRRWMLLLSLLVPATLTGCGQPEELPYVELSSSGPAEVQRPGQPALARKVQKNAPDGFYIQVLEGLIAWMV